MNGDIGLQKEKPNKINLTALVDLYELTMAASYFEHKRNTQAAFDLFIRKLPKNRSYFLTAGLEDVLDYLENFHFDEKTLEYLRVQKKFSQDFLEYLKNLKFTGDVWALPEGTIFFPNEPIIRIKAPIIQAQIIESTLLNIINLNTLIATKASRVVNVAGDKGIYDFSLRRTHGSDAGLKAARAAYLAGCRGTSNVLAGLLYKIPTAGTMAHSFVMSFDNELSSFRAFANTFPRNSILLIDTYDNLKGVENAITVARELNKNGYRLRSVRIDSGNLVKISKKIRKILDKNHFPDIKIFASGNLDEYKIKRLIDLAAKIDDFGVGTNMGTSNDMPYCDVIYKISEVSDNSGQFLPTMKLSKGKSTYPGRKQIFRQYDVKGSFNKDILGLEDEKIKGKPLLVKVMQGGENIYNQPRLEDIRIFALDNIARLPSRFKKLINAPRYPVEISPGLKKLTKKLEKELKKRSYR